VKCRIPPNDEVSGSLLWDSNGTIYCWRQRRDCEKYKSHEEMELSNMDEGRSQVASRQRVIPDPIRLARAAPNLGYRPGAAGRRVWLLSAVSSQGNAKPVPGANPNPRPVEDQRFEFNKTILSSIDCSSYYCTVCCAHFNLN